MPSPDALLGQTVSHYRVIRKLGEGGMGEVYLAQDAALDRTVALKFLLPKVQADETARKRLLAEARSAAALDHPFICKVYEASEADHQPFIAMEYVEGASLKEKLREGALPVREALRIAVEISEALECAHERGIIHRDLKPSNILVTRDAHVKVLDFGLATHLPSGSLATEKTATTALTQAGETPGTLTFMSPEQLKGEPADTRSDIFAFGLILYEMISGVHPFVRESPLKTACAILDDPPPPIVPKGEGAPKLLDPTLKRMLAKDREKRFQSIHEVRTNLTELLQERQPPARTLTPRGRALGPMWLTVSILAAVIGLAGTGYWAFKHYFLSPKSALAFEKRDWIVIADFENLTRDPVFDRSLQTALVVGIQQSQYVNVLPPARIREALVRMRKETAAKLDEPVASELAVRERAKAVLACSIAEVGGAYSLTARLVEPRSRGTVLIETTVAQGKNQVLPALDSLAKSIRKNLGESLSGVKQQGLPLPEATTASLEALTTFAEGLKLATTNGDAAANLVEQAVAIDPDFALAHAYLGARYYGTNDTVRGEEHFVKAMNLLDRLTLREQMWIRAQAEDFRGHREQAVQYYEAYLAQYPDDYSTRFRLGWVYMAALRDYPKAIDAFNKVLQANPHDSSAYINLASCYDGLLERQKALEYYQKAFQITPAQMTERYVNQEYGALQMSMGNTAKAAEAFQEMVAQQPNFKKALGYRSLGMLAIYQGKFTEGIANLKQAVLFHRALQVSESEYRDHFLLASAYRTKGFERDFLSELETARSMLARGHLGPVWIASVAKAYARLGNTAVATKLLQDIISEAQDPTALSGVNRTSDSDKAYISVVKGEIALSAGKSSEALDAIQLSDKLYSNTLATESLANAYRVLGKPQDAARVYEDALSHDKFPLLTEGQESWIFAHYDLGKIYQELGDTAKAKEYYEQFLNLWKDADLDIPLLKRAKAEYAKLQ